MPNTLFFPRLYTNTPFLILGEKAREQKDRAQRDAQNQQFAGLAYRIPSPDDIPSDGGELSGLPWGSFDMRHVMTRGHHAAASSPRVTGTGTGSDSRRRRRESLGRATATAAASVVYDGGYLNPYYGTATVMSPGSYYRGAMGSGSGGSISGSVTGSGGSGGGSGGGGGSGDDQYYQGSSTGASVGDDGSPYYYDYDYDYDFDRSSGQGGGALM